VKEEPWKPPSGVATGTSKVNTIPIAFKNVPRTNPIKKELETIRSREPPLHSTPSLHLITNLIPIASRKGGREAAFPWNFET
jgi:hypothetical protein